MNGAPKNCRISKKYNGSLYSIPYPADSKSWRIPEFRKMLNGFFGIPVKINKILVIFMEFQFITVFPLSSMGGMWIFSGIAQSSLANGLGGKNVLPFDPVNTVPNNVLSFFQLDIFSKKPDVLFSGKSGVQ